MRLGLKADNLLERVADWFNLAPKPLAHAFFWMMAARTLMAGERLGVFAALAQGEATVEELAAPVTLVVDDYDEECVEVEGNGFEWIVAVDGAAV